MNVGGKFEIRNEKFHSYLLGQIILIPESVAVSNSQEILHYDSAKKRTNGSTYSYDSSSTHKTSHVIQGLRKIQNASLF